MATYAQATDRIADSTSVTLKALQRKFDAGQISRAEFISAGGAAISAAVMQAGQVADVALAQRLTKLTGEQVYPLGVRPDDYPEADKDLAHAADVGLADLLDVVARAAVRAAGQSVFDKGLIGHEVPGWRRVTDGGCKVCNDLAAAPFLPSYIPMWRHKGCGCHPDPVMDDPQGGGSGR